MNTLLRQLFLMCACVLVSMVVFSQSKEEYPNLDKQYTDKQLDSFLKFYQTKHDTLGIVYTYILWQNESRNISFDEKKKIISMIYTNRHLVKHHSEYNYNALLLMLSEQHDDNYKSLTNSIERCDSVLVYSQQNKKPLLARKALVNKMFLLLDMHSDTLWRALPQLYAYNYLWPQYAFMETEYYYLSGAAHVYAKQYAEAIKSFNQLLTLVEGTEYRITRHLAVLFLAQCHRIEGNYHQAEQYALQSLSIGANIGNLHLLRWTYQELAMINHHQKNFKESSDYWLKYWDIEEEIRLNNVQKLNNTGISFELLESELRQSNLQKQLDKQEIAQKKLITDSLWAMCLLLVFLLGLGILAYRQKVRLSNQEKQMALYQGQEQERSYIAKELHDDLGSTLAGIKAQIPPSLPNFTLLNKHLGYVYEKIKTFSHALHTDDIEQVGLRQTCQDFINLIDKQGIINFSVYGQEILIPAFEATMIYRVIQELLINALQHAQATKVYFNLYFDAKQIHIAIEDNGKGMVQPTHSTGIGLANIQKRINLLGGKIEISTSADGTSFFISIPFDNFFSKYPKW